MKNLLKKISVSALIWSFLAYGANSFENQITVKFKEKVTPEFISLLNKMTNTKVIQKINNNTYKFEINGIVTRSSFERYAEFFMIMRNVNDISPLPKINPDDKFNPVLYINLPDYSKKKNEKKTTPEQNKSKSDNVNNDEINEFSTTPETIPEQGMTSGNEFIVKLNKEMLPEDIETLNNSSGAIVTFQKDSESYKITIPENVDPEYVQNYYKNNSNVLSFEPVVSPVNSENKTNQTETTKTNNQAIMAAIPLNGRDVRISFKPGEEETVKWISQNFGAKLVAKKGFNSFILRFPDYINPKMAARAMKACNSILSAQVVSD